VKVIAAGSEPDALGLIELLASAAGEFNRTLDIRLRFLDIGIDLIPIRPLRGQPTSGSEIWRGRVRQVLRQERPRLLVVLAGDTAAEPAAREAAEQDVRTVVLVPEGSSSEELRERYPQARLHGIGDLEAPAEGRRLVEILVAERAES
jgi:hypothetical protein